MPAHTHIYVFIELWGYLFTTQSLMRYCPVGIIALLDFVFFFFNCEEKLQKQKNYYSNYLCLCV